MHIHQLNLIKIFCTTTPNINILQTKPNNNIYRTTKLNFDILKN